MSSFSLSLSPPALVRLYFFCRPALLLQCSLTAAGVTVCLGRGPQSHVRTYFSRNSSPPSCSSGSRMRDYCRTRKSNCMWARISAGGEETVVFVAPLRPVSVLAIALAPYVR